MGNLKTKVGLYIIILLFPLATQAQFKVVGYLYNWGSFVSDAQAIDYTKITHVNIAFVNPTSSTTGNLSPTNNLTTVVNIIKNNGAKAMVSLGGAGASTDWSGLLKTQTSRTMFVQKISQFVTDYNLDGIDLDVEGDLLNGSLITASQYESFVVELGDSLKAKNKIYSAALASWFASYVTNKAAQKFDFINVMSYDSYGTWTGPGQHSSYNSMISDYNVWILKVTNKSKLVIGLPSYGYKWVSNSSSGSSSVSYKNIVASYPRAVNKDSIIPAPGQVIYYNGPTTIRNKTNYAKNNAGGVMMWTIQFDLPTSDPNSLFLNISSVSGVLSLNPSEAFSLDLNIYPNPSTTEIQIESDPSFPISKIELYSSLGELVYTETSPTMVGENQTITLQIATLPSGLYQVVAHSRDRFQSKKLLKL